MRPVWFHWRDKKKDREKGKQLGFIAQEVEKIYPAGGIVDSTNTDATFDSGDGKEQTVSKAKFMNYSALTVPLVKAVQELKSLFDGDHEMLVKLEAEFEAYKAAHP